MWELEDSYHLKWWWWIYTPYRYDDVIVIYYFDVMGSYSYELVHLVNFKSMELYNSFREENLNYVYTISRAKIDNLSP